MSPFTVIAFLFTLIVAAFAAPTDNERVVLTKRARTGRGTFFNVGLGACGKTNVDSDSIIAVSASLYGNGEHCDQGVSITNTVNNLTASAIVRDKCPSCGADDIDMSPSLFQQIGDLNAGVLTVSWDFT